MLFRSKPATRVQFEEYKKTAVGIYKKGRLKQAQKIFQRLALVNDRDSTIQKYSRLIETEIRQQAEEYFVRGFGYWGQKKYRAARRDFELVYDLQPDYPKIQYFLDDVKKQIQLTQGAIDSLLLIAKEKEKLKQYTGAISAYGKILNIDPENSAARNALSDIHPKVESYLAGLSDQANKSFKAGEYFNTEALCRKILRIDPEKTAARELRIRSREKRKSRADDLWQQGLKVYADKKYKAAINLLTNKINGWHDSLTIGMADYIFADANLQLKNYKYAVLYAQKAISKNYNIKKWIIPYSYYFIAEAYYQQGKNKLSKRYL